MMSVGASIIVKDVGGGGVLRGSSDVSKGAQLEIFCTMKGEEWQLVGVIPRSALGNYPKGFMPRVTRGGFVLQRATKPAKV